MRGKNQTRPKSPHNWPDGWKSQRSNVMCRMHAGVYLTIREIPLTIGKDHTNPIVTIREIPLIIYGKEKTNPIFHEFP